MKLEKVRFISSYKELIYTFLVLITITTFSILIKYHQFTKLQRFDDITLIASVIGIYTIKDKTYIKFDSNDGYIFFAKKRTKKSIEIADMVKVKILTSRLTFLGFLKGFYTYAIYKKVFKQKKSKLQNYFISQHKDNQVKEIFLALFFAKPMSKELREKFSALGISHLVAISGFHISLLGGLIFIILLYPYRFFQRLYFPYRNSKIDLFFISSILLFIYMNYINYPPSLIRAYVMMILAMFLYLRHIDIINFETLLLTILLILSFNISLVFSYGFWLSVLGVFYIFLFLYTFKISKTLTFIGLHFFIYFMMLPYTFYLFSSYSSLHFSSIFISMLFYIFYPLELFLHIINHGYIFDEYILKYLNLVKIETKEIGLICLISFFTLSLLSIKYKKLIYVLILFSLFLGFEYENIFS